MFGKKANAKAATQASEATPADAAASAPASAPAKPLTLKEQQEQKRKAYHDKIAATRQKLAEQQKLKLEREKAYREELRKKQKRSMITFTMGLFVMLTVLICMFPTTPMIIFSTLLMFSFFFLGIAYQRIVMQLLVVAMACVAITGAFFMIMNSV